MGGLSKKSFLGFKPQEKQKALQWLQGETNISVEDPAPKADLKKQRVGIIMFGQLGVAAVTDATYVGVGVTIQAIKIRQLIKAGVAKIDDILGWGTEAAQIKSSPPMGFSPAKVIVTLVRADSLETDQKRTSNITGRQRPAYKTASGSLPFGRGTEATETGTNPVVKTTIATSDYYEVMQSLNEAIRGFNGNEWKLKTLTFKPEDYPTPDLSGELITAPSGALKPQG